MIGKMLAIALLALVAAVVVYGIRAMPTYAGSFGERLRAVFANWADELGAVTLAQSALLSENDLQQGVVETFVIESVVLDAMPMESISGNAFAYNEEATLPGVEFRAVNAAYTESTGTVTQKTESLVILGGDADVDTYIVRTRGNVNDQRAVQERLKVKAAVYKYQDAFINGDTAVDANSFDGLKKRITGAQIIDAAVNGLPVLGADDAARHAFLDQLDALIAAVAGGADVLYMNNLILAKIKSSARRIGTWTSTIDDFGRTIDRYNGIPMRDIGTKADGTLIIPQTETQGSSSVASSIYAVHWGDSPETGGVMGLFNGPSEDQVFDVRDLGEIDAKPVFRTRIEGFIGLGVFGGKSAARLRGVLNS
jgi:hypothetical protein